MTSLLKNSLAILSFCGSIPSAIAAEKRPNVVFIFADELASEGFRSIDFFVPANVCGPSRAVLLTGRYPMPVRHEVIFTSE